MIPRYTRKEMGGLWSDDTKYAAWLRVEIAVLEARAKLGEIPSHIPDLVQSSAKISRKRIEKLDALFGHDMNAFLHQVSETLPREARPYLHLGLTSYDVEDTALGMLLLYATHEILRELQECKNVLFKRALEYKDTLQIERTHGMHAEPTTFGYKLLQWYDELHRHMLRIERNRNEWETGKISGAVGNYAHVGPDIEEKVCRTMHLASPRVASQILSRDRYALYICLLALVAGSLEKFTTDIRLLSQTEIGEVKEPRRKMQKGSSAMPHKSSDRFANPVLCENLCSLAGVMRGFVVTMLEAQVTWHGRDLINSARERIILSGATILIDFMLFRFRKIIEGLRVFPDKMRENLWSTGGMIFSGAVLEALMKKGMGRERAHALLEDLVRKADEECIPFQDIVVNSKLIRRYLSLEDIYACFDPTCQLRFIDAVFERFLEDHASNS